jgi:hypothetical protein
VADRGPHAAPAAAGQPDTLAFDALILATGATDRVLPFMGWTLPGVFTLGAAQVALKAQASADRPARGVRRHRAAAVPGGLAVRAGRWRRCRRCWTPPRPRRAAGALPKLLARPAVAAKGAWLLARLQLAGVPVRRGVRCSAPRGKGA